MANVKLGNDASGSEFDNISTKTYARFIGGEFSVDVEAGDTLTLLGIGEVRANTSGANVSVAVYDGSTYERIAYHQFTFTNTSDYVRQTQVMDVDLTPFAGQTIIIAAGEWGDVRALLLPSNADYFGYSNGNTTLADPYANRTGFVSAIGVIPFWAEIQRGPSLTVTQSELTPGGTISGSYEGYETVPTTLTVSDGTNTVTISSPTITDNGDGTGTFSGTMPSLPSSGTASLILFGDVTVELT
ncbi:hypothetical protein O4H29_06870 [Marinobacter salarius]|uniref:hypothetical protein n=1 Tax=Marinobacter salarius TaxID=1420917 RepID=UPI0022B18F7D|nr:hypothetical protein [Marinobacter salarius]MCZ4284555.1 hypothetical protein [Marinobacter salarius]